MAQNAEITGVWNSQMWHPEGRLLRRSVLQLDVIDGHILGIPAEREREILFTFDLTQSEEGQLDGTWHDFVRQQDDEETALYRGAGTLMLNPTHDHAEGYWTGLDPDSQIPIAGRWILLHLKYIEVEKLRTNANRTAED